MNLAPNVYQGRRLLNVDLQIVRFVNTLAEACKRLGGGVLVAEGLRNAAIQNAYYAQGRRPLAEVNRLRAIAKMQPITEAENRDIVTRAAAGLSPHEYGCAVDVYFTKTLGRTAEGLPGTKIETPQFFDAILEIVNVSGSNLRAGFDWNRNGTSLDEKFIDRPHVERIDWPEVKKGKLVITPFNGTNA